jgi:hypothetical protein
MKKRLLRVAALSVVLTFAITVNGYCVGGSIGHGDISVFKEGQLATKLTGRNPIEDGSMLVCDGKCMVKSQGISLIAGDKSQIAVTNEEDTFRLYVKEGKVDYVISSNARKIAFYTPQGKYTVAEAMFNASGSSAVKGAVEVIKDGTTEILVSEGKMVFVTADGRKVVDANNKLVLAAAMVPPGPQTTVGTGAATTGTGAAAGAKTTVTGSTVFGVPTMTLAAVGTVAAVGVGAVVVNNNNDDDPAPQSTSSSSSSGSGSGSSGSGTSGGGSTPASKSM